MRKLIQAVRSRLCGRPPLRSPTSPTAVETKRHPADRRARERAYRVRVRVTSGEPSRDAVTYQVRATSAVEAYDRTGIDALHFFVVDSEADGHTFTADVRERAGGPMQRFDGEFPTPDLYS